MKTTYLTEAPKTLPCLFTTWNDYLTYLIETPLKQRWYSWNPHYRISLRVVISQVKAKVSQ